MTKRLIFGSYVISGGCIWFSNKTSYSPTNKVMNTFWDMLKINSSYGKTVAVTNFVLAPALVPVHTITLSLLCGIDYGCGLFNRFKNNKD